MQMHSPAPAIGCLALVSKPIAGKNRRAAFGVVRRQDGPVANYPQQSVVMSVSAQSAGSWQATASYAGMNPG